MLTFKLNANAFTNEIPARTNVSDPGPILIVTPLISPAEAPMLSSPQERSAPNVLNGKSQLFTAESKIASPSRPITTRYSFDDDSTATNKLMSATGPSNQPTPVAIVPRQRKTSACASCPASPQTQNRWRAHSESPARQCRPTRRP